MWGREYIGSMNDILNCSYVVINLKRDFHDHVVSTCNILSRSASGAKVLMFDPIFRMRRRFEQTIVVHCPEHLDSCTQYLPLHYLKY